MTAAVATRSVGLAMRRVPGRALVLIVAVAVAYHYSLLSLARGLSLQTPLAYLGLVPLIAVLLGALHATRRPSLSPYDLRLDFMLGRLLGLFLLVLSLGIAVVVPETTGLDFWLLRVDLLTLPLFASGVVGLLYGVRRLWNLRFAILFLLLAWPAPYIAVMSDVMAASVTATVAALGAIAVMLPLATPVGGSEGLFIIGSGDNAIPVAVASACSGVNSVVGFALVGTALFSVLQGSLRRRLAWLMAGLAFTWLLNVLRIEVIFATGALGSPQLALNVLHPIAGLLVFNLGILAMLLVAERFGLQIGLSPRADGGPTAAEAAAPRRRLGWTIVLVGGAAIAMGLVNTTYAGFRPIGGEQGLPAISGFQAGRAWVPDWTSRTVAAYEHGRQFFGEDSTWTRSVYTPVADAVMRANVPVYVDVINTDDPAALGGYSVESCYSFHGYLIESSNEVELVGGLTASLRSYADPRSNTDWTILAWEWPTQRDGAVRYERVVLLLPDGDDAQFSGVPRTDLAQPSDRFGEAEHLLVTLARTMVTNQVASESGRSDS